MTTDKKIIKFSLIWKLMLVLLMSLCSIGDAWAKLPKCETIPAGSEKCKCGRGIAAITCEVGQACEQFISTQGEGSLPSFSCVALSNAETSHGTFGSSAVLSTNSTDFLKLQPYNPCKSSCAPKCYYNELTECTFCPLFTAFYNAASKVAKRSIDSLSKPIQQLLVMMFALWIAFQVLAFVSSPEVKDLKDLISSLITQSFIVLLV